MAGADYYYVDDLNTFGVPQNRGGTYDMLQDFDSNPYHVNAPAPSNTNQNKVVIYRCQICSTVYQGREAYERHKQQAHGIQPKTSKSQEKRTEVYQCGYCDNKYISQGYLIAHLRKAHDIEVAQGDKNSSTLNLDDIMSGKTEVCQYCAMTFKNKSGLASHITLVHNIDHKTGVSSNMLACDQCNRKFGNEKSLRSHKEKLHGIPGAPGQPRTLYPCHDCGRKFSQESWLKKHKRKLHGPAGVEPLVGPKGGPAKTYKEYACELCPESFLQKMPYVNHMQYVHQKTVDLGELNLKECKLCMKAFASSQLLDKHRNEVHAQQKILNINEDKEIFCDKCGLTFSQPGSYANHMDKVHKIKVKWNRCNCMNPYDY